MKLFDLRCICLFIFIILSYLSLCILDVCLIFLKFNFVKMPSPGHVITIQDMFALCKKRSKNPNHETCLI